MQAVWAGGIAGAPARAARPAAGRQPSALPGRGDGAAAAADAIRPHPRAQGAWVIQVHGSPVEWFY